MISPDRRTRGDGPIGVQRVDPGFARPSGASHTQAERRA